MNNLKKTNVLLVLGAGLSMLSLSACGSRCEDAKEKVIEPVQTVAAYLNTQPTGEELAVGCGTLLQNLNGLPEGADTIREIAQDRYVHSYAVCTRYATGVRLVCNGWYASDAEADAAENSDVLVKENSEVAANASTDVVMELMAGRPGPGVRPSPGRPAPRPGFVVRPRPPVAVVRPIPRPYPGYPPVRRYPACRNVVYSYCANYDYRSDRNEPMFNQAMDLAKNLDVLYFKSNEMCQNALAQKPNEAVQIAKELQASLASDLIPNGSVFYRNACGN